LSQNPSVQSPWHPNHCFSTIPNHLIHHLNDFGWLGRGSMGSKSCTRLVWLLSWMSKNQLLQNIIFEPDQGVQSPWHPDHCFSTIPNQLIHPQNDFGWLGGKGIHGL
jgi:hypothetical protein